MAEDPRDPDDARDPEDELREMLQRFLSGDGEIDPSQLAGAAGMPTDPAALQAIMAQLQAALQHTGDGIDWSVAQKQALQVISRDPGSVTSAERDAVQQAARIAAMWLGEATSIGSIDELTLLSRQQWMEATMPVWQELSEPVATSIADALTSAMQDHAPEEAREMVEGAQRLLRNVGGTLFAMQLGTIVGKLSGEVVSGGDIGFPLLDQQAALLPVNLRELGAGLEIPDDQVQIWMAVREFAHARLFHHARWLRLHVLSSIREYAEGIRIDMQAIEDLAADFDPQNPEQLQAALGSGSLIPPKSEEQVETLARLETTLALIEGWVDQVTNDASSRLPKRDAIAETVRRRRATGGPAESAFGTLVGLEIRPRRLREAAAFWQAVTDAAGPEKRDSLWDHPDLLPTSDDIDDPSRVIASLTGGTPPPDDIDLALAELLGDETGDRPHEGLDGTATDDSGGDAAGTGDAGADGSGTDEQPEQGDDRS